MMLHAGNKGPKLCADVNCGPISITITLGTPYLANMRLEARLLACCGGKWRQVCLFAVGCK